jgi:hypothetical protein
LRKELKRSSIEYGNAGNPDYNTMKKLYQDPGYEGFIPEKKSKKRSLVNNILPGLKKISPLTVYGDPNATLVL